MTTLDDIQTLFDPADGPRPGAAPARKCRRHDWCPATLADGSLQLISGFVCARCHKPKDASATRRAHSSIRAGKDAERAIAKAYPGGIRTGHHGGPDDVLVGDLFIVQSKAGGWFSERVWAELQKLPRLGGRIPTLIVSDRPGPGHRTRRYVVRLLADDVDLHGHTTEGGTE